MRPRQQANTQAVVKTATSLGSTVIRPPSSVISRQLSTCNTGSSQNKKSYKSVDDSDVSRFVHLIGEKNVLTDPDTIEPYNRDWMDKFQGKSKVVLTPTTTEEVSSILQYCNDNRIAVTPQGGNTGLVGGSVPCNDEVIISLSKLNKIIEFNKYQGIVVAEAGVVLENLITYLDEQGFTMPLDLGAKGSCMIGGNISTNAGGLRYVRYGSLRGNVLGLEAVLPNGKVLDLLSTMRKDNTGYDLKQLFIGAEGTLGIVTKVAILAPPKPTSQHVIYMALPSFEQVLGVMQLARSMMSDIISAIEYQDATSFRLVQKHSSSGTLRQLPWMSSTQDNSQTQPNTVSPFYMLIETSGSNAEHDYDKLLQFFDKCTEKFDNIPAVMSETRDDVEGLWKYRERVPIAAGMEGYVYKYDISLPLHQFPAVVEKVRQKVKAHNLQVMGYGHLGDGNLHINIVKPRTDSDINADHDPIMEVLEPWIFDEVAQLRGSISAEHGLGRAKNEYIHYSKPAPAIQLMQQIKDQFDPNGIMNPYKYLPENR